MNILKSLQSGILHKTFDYNGKSFFVISLLWGFQLDSGHPVLEQELWRTLGPTLENGDMLDAGMPKSRGEFLAFGSFFSPTGAKVQGGRVSISLGALHKELYVFGDRKWGSAFETSLGITEPEPATEIPITYANAFGGAGYEKNPIGKGYVTVQSESGTYHPLPNIQYPGSVIGSPNDTPEPASFSRIDMTWIPRAAKAGTYDDKYIAKRMPGLPDDIEWTFFNEAAEDQWVQKYFKGDEAFEIINMSPDHPVLKGKLPGIYARCFVNQEKDHEIEFKEISCKLDTVLLYPKENLGCVIHRGTLGVAQDDGTDIKHVLLAHENLNDPPRTIEHYKKEITCRMDPDEGFKYMMYTVPLLPNGCRCGFELLQEQQDASTENLMASNFETYAKKQESEYRELADEKMAEVMQKQEEMLKNLKDAGVDTKPLTAEIDQLKEKMEKMKGSDMEALPADAEKIKEIIENILPGATEKDAKIQLSKLNIKGFEDFQAYMMQMAEDKKKNIKEQIKEKLQEFKNREGFQKLKDLKETKEFKEFQEFDGVADNLDDTFDLDQIIDAMDNSPKTREKPAPLPRIKLAGQLDDVKQRIAKSDEQMQELREKTLSMGDLGKLAEEATKEQIDEAQKAFDESFEKTDLSGLKKQIDDMVGPLKEAEDQAKNAYAMTAHYIEEASSPHEGREGKIAQALISAYKNGRPTADGDYAFVDLSNRDLSGINLSGCYLEYADLSGTDLSNADLSNAILAHAKIIGTNLTNANLKGANIGAATIEDALFVNADLTGATLGKSEIKKTKFHQCTFKDRQDLFMDTCFHIVDFSGSAMRECNFIELDFTGCCFNEADLSQSNFIQPKLNNTLFNRAILDGVNFIQVNGESVQFSGAKMKNIRFVGGCTLIRSDFMKAELSESCLRECNFKKSDFSGARLDKADFGGSDLTYTKFNRSEAFQTQFMKADLSFAMLYRINLMEGNLMKARIVGADFREANLFSTSFLKSIVDRNTDFTDAYIEQTVLVE